MSSPILLEARDLCRSKADGGLLLDHVNVSVAVGERVAVAGPSGAGKTLLLRALATLDPLTSGEIRYRGQPISRQGTPAFRAQVIYLHQRPSLFEGTIEDNLRIPMTLNVHRHRTFDRDRVVHWLEKFGRTAEVLSKRDRDLSGGETQIVALIRAIQCDPTILLLDEATSALDHDMVRSAETLVHEWRTGERSAVWVSHDAAQAQRIADRTIRMNQGRVMPDARAPE